MQSEKLSDKNEITKQKIKKTKMIQEKLCASAMAQIKNKSLRPRTVYYREVILHTLHVSRILVCS